MAAAVLGLAEEEGLAEEAEGLAGGVGFEEEEEDLEPLEVGLPLLLLEVVAGFLALGFSSSSSSE